MLALANERGAGQNDREHGDVVDDLHHRCEPFRLEIGVEHDAEGEVDRLNFRSAGGCGGSCSACGVGLHHLVDDLLQIDPAVAGLSDRGRIHIDLEARIAIRDDVLLELGRNLDHEHVAARVHRRTDFRRRDLDRRLEPRRKNCLPDQPGKLGAVLVDNGGRNMIDFRLGPGRDGVNGVAERIDGQRQQDRVGADAVQLLQAQREDVEQFPEHVQDSCFRRMSAATPRKATVKPANARWLIQSSGNPSPLVKAPTLICWK